MLKFEVGPTVQVEKASCDDFYLDITSLCSDDGCFDNVKQCLGSAASFPSNLRQRPPDELKFIHEVKEQGKNLGKADDNAINKRLSVWSNVSSELQRGIWIAYSIRQSLFQKLGLTASCAVSRSKLISRLASPVNKPNGLTLVPSEAAAVEFIGAIPVKRIPSMQRKFGAEVQETLQVDLVKDLVKFKRKDLEARFGSSRGKFLFDLPAAIDETPVADRGPSKSITLERSFPPMKNQESLLSMLKNLVEQLLLRGAEDFAEHSRLPIKLGIGFRLGYDTNLVSRSGSVPLELLDWLRSSVNSDSTSFCDGAVDAIEVASSAVMMLLKGATNGRWDITRAAVIFHYSADTSSTFSKSEQHKHTGPTIGELFKAALPVNTESGEMAKAEDSTKKKKEQNRAGRANVGTQSLATTDTRFGANGTYRNAEALALQAMFIHGNSSSGGGGGGAHVSTFCSKLNSSNEDGDDLDKASLDLALKLQREEAQAISVSNGTCRSDKKKKRGPMDSFIVFNSK
jgi:nucleotidyltransferase/DNA polymerase involved in DNA repair